MPPPSPSPSPATADANALLAYLDRQLAQRTAAWPEVLATTVVSLAAQFDDYDWTGIYLVRDDVLHLGPFVGHATDHVTIPVGRGICGAAAAERRTIVVDDVTSDARYLACFANTRSEIVVPILDRARAAGAPLEGARDEVGRVIGEIDVDSDRPAAFGPADRAYLEEVAERLARLAPSDGEDVIVPTLAIARAARALSGAALSPAPESPAPERTATGGEGCS